jgi:6-pyruvoyl-tetrahydropterin synthase
MVKLFVNKLTHLDFSMLCPERGLTGESWFADVVLTGDLDAQGMVMDFGAIKRRLRDGIEALVDHQLVVPDTADFCTVASAGSRMQVRWETAAGAGVCSAPEAAIARLPLSDLSPGQVARWMMSRLAPTVPERAEILAIRLYPAVTEGAFFHYSHGLAAHEGGCQRIAHGHRSLLQVWVDGELRQDLAQTQADALQDIYLATEAHRVAVLGDQWQFAYAAREGAFSLSLPARQCLLLPTQTTIENIAIWLACQMSGQHPGCHLRVQVYEGIDKGAEAVARDGELLRD